MVADDNSGDGGSPFARRTNGIGGDTVSCHICDQRISELLADGYSMEIALRVAKREHGDRNLPTKEFLDREVLRRQGDWAELTE